MVMNQVLIIEEPYAQNKQQWYDWFHFDSFLQHSNTSKLDFFETLLV